MTASHTLCALLIVSITACSHFEPADCSSHCGRAPQVIDSKVGEIRSSAYHSWSYHFGYTFDCWVIKGSEDEPIILSFSQFSVRCEKEYLSIKSSVGGEPHVLCGSKLPQPLEFPGGNITLMHHFSPQEFPVSLFILSYARDSGDCPDTSFQCPEGRCLPLSWRCNGQVECLGDGLHSGLDEVGCDDYVDYPEVKPVSYTDRITGLDSDNSRTNDKSWVRSTERYTFPETWPRPRDQPTQKELAVTPTPIEWPCGGLFQTFYGTFAAPSSVFGTMTCIWTLDPEDPRPLRLDLHRIMLGQFDRITVYNQGEGKGEAIKNITSVFNGKSVKVESHTGLMSLVFDKAADSMVTGFKATFHVGNYCPPSETRCGGSSGGCFTKEQRCDGKWDCPETGRDELGCRGCSENQFACGLMTQGAVASRRYTGTPVCYPVTERCNYQLYCTDGSDEKDCSVCQPGTFHCDSNRCVFESWRCDGQVDCKDGTDELDCTVMLPRKVITAATVGSLICGLLLVIAMGCTCKLYSLRTREYSMFAPISRMEAQMIQQQAPPSYGQLIAQGIIPPVEDFPTESPNEAASLSLRGILQLLRQDTSSSPHRRRRPRFVRRAIRRMRRWGLIPRTSSRQNQSSSSNQQEGNSASSNQEATQSSPARSSSAVEAVNQPVPQKLGLLAQAEQQQMTAWEEVPASLLPLSPPPILSTPPPPYAPPAPTASAPQTPPVTVPPSSPSLASIFHTIGLSMSRFRASPFSSSTNYMPLSASPSFSSSSSSDDDVLLIPLSEETTSEDDVPMLT
ncbi:PREDICTED: low-density lipoprotein receptor-related protein 10 isoform X2 [Cyprinodon variegatus]|uniref:Low density lipoprotein receptor-related protein 10 n=1 Tax=Cyprinodon variegatus TaxID=28743 RepID=A0A3Q2CKA2_CYPVA|nr:PREDICTED: low-density lipoprotein receptor-related protein 10 isoform X1 [Cyprinodon variegatus]XP_015255874.1 PREDICTED: low-density lipoprotein receptor-related protein 10 isoform X2 [Cyprinodon variegatus]